MNDAQRAEFAANGYIVIPAVLSKAQLQELNAVYDAHHPALNPDRPTDLDPARARSVTDRHGNHYKGRRFWSKAYRDLVDHPKMLPILREILGNPEWGHAPAHMPKELRESIRLDHHNIHYRQPLAFDEGATLYTHGAPALHGGPENWHVTCVYELLDVPPSDGGFGACPGSQTPAGFAKVRNVKMS
eukprot:SAG31_NODE_10222_length_1168_cov_1.569691_1_plen_187_part_00